MNARLRDCDIETARIRALQAIYSEAHQALCNWGLWSSDKRFIYPTLKPPALWNQFARSKVEEWGDEMESPVRLVLSGPAKPEPRERDPYDEKKAIALDERIHGSGGLRLDIRQMLKIAYATGEVPEYQFPALCGCSLDTLCERLEEALRFVRRFAG